MKACDLNINSSSGLEKGTVVAEKLTFKEYLASKEKLREAIKNVPTQKTEYVMRKYCKLPVGESKEEKEYVALKPKNKVIVEWLYEDVNNPSVVSLSFEDVDGVSESEEFSIYWSDDRFRKWLNKHTREL